MSIKWINRVWECETLRDKGETLVMLALADWANDDGEAYPALVQLAKKSRVSKRGLLNILARLKDVYIEWDSSDGGRNKRNKYQLLLHGLKGEPASPFSDHKKGKTRHEKGEPASLAINRQYNHQSKKGGGDSNTKSFNPDGNAPEKNSDLAAAADLSFLTEKDRVYEPSIRDALKQFAPSSIDLAFIQLLKGDHRRTNPLASILALQKKYGHEKMIAALVVAGSENKGGASLKFVEGIMKRWAAPSPNGVKLVATEDRPINHADFSFLDGPITD